MIHRFYSFEDASIHAGVMRSRGHAAAVLDEGVGFLYGPVLTNGYRVWVSDDPVTDEEDAGEAPSAGEPPAAETRPARHPLADALRVIVGALMMTGLLALGIGLVVLAASLLVAIRSLLIDGPSDWSGAVGVAVLLGGIALILGGGPLMVRMTRSFRDPGSPLGWTFRGAVILFAVAELVIAVVLLLAELFDFFRYSFF